MSAGKGRRWSPRGGSGPGGRGCAPPGSAAPPPPPLPSEPPIQVLSRVVALYPFTGEAETSISMAEGEQFFVTEQDVEGWTRVRRVSADPEIAQVEGFVPSSFIKYTS